MTIQQHYPKISVVCPSFNSADFIIPTLQSVVSQTESPYELIISDDGSTDDTCTVVSKFISEHSGFPVRLVRNKHLGPGAARNSAIRESRGDWIAFIDSDDVWQPNKISVVIQAIKANSDANFISHAEDHIRLDGSIKILCHASHYKANISLTRQLYEKNLFSTSAVICRKQIIIDRGFFDESLRSAQDYELWLRLSPILHPVFILDSLGSYCDRIGNITSKNLFRRLKNIVIISARYRSTVGVVIFIKKVIFVSCSMVLQTLKTSMLVFRVKLSSSTIACRMYAGK